MGGLLCSSDMWAPTDLQYGEPAYSMGGGGGGGGMLIKLWYALMVIFNNSAIFVCLHSSNEGQSSNRGQGTVQSRPLQSSTLL